jgi:hypothetical protein
MVCYLDLGEARLVVEGAIGIVDFGAIGVVLVT